MRMRPRLRTALRRTADGLDVVSLRLAYVGEALERAAARLRVTTHPRGPLIVEPRVDATELRKVIEERWAAEWCLAPAPPTYEVIREGSGFPPPRVGVTGEPPRECEMEGGGQ